MKSYFYVIAIGTPGLRQDILKIASDTMCRYMQDNVATPRIITSNTFSLKHFHLLPWAKLRVDAGGRNNILSILPQALSVFSGLIHCRRSVKNEILYALNTR